MILFFEPLSLWERGWGEGPVSRGAQDDLKHRSRIFKRIVVPETQYTQTSLLQQSCAHGVFGVAVLRSIDFDHELCFTAMEIRDPRWKWMLSAKLQTVEASRAQVVAKFRLGVG